MKNKAKRSHGSVGVTLAPATRRPETWLQQHPHHLVLALLVVVIVCLFSYTVVIRQPWFGTLSTSPYLGHHQWLTGSTIKFTRNWYREGAAHLGFLMLENPRSVEFPTLESRGIYISYPPGTLLPIYAISKLIRQEPTPVMVDTFNLVNHLLIALGLAAIIYLVLMRIGLHPVHAGLFAVIPPIIVLLLPAPIYHFQNVFFSDQAIVLPCVLMILGEVVREYPLTTAQRRWLDLAQGLLLWYGFFTDWFFVFIGVACYVKRLLRGQTAWRAREAGVAGLGRRRSAGTSNQAGEAPASQTASERRREFFRQSLAFWIGPCIALALFAVQLTAFHQWNMLFDKFLFRAALTEGGREMVTNFYQRFWAGFVAVGYGGLAVYLLWGSLLALCVGLVYLWSKRLQPAANRPAVVTLLTLMSLTLLPCFIEIYTLKNHSYVHDFAALKLLIPLSIVPFVLLPVWLLILTRQIPPRKTEQSSTYVYSPRILAVNLLLLICVAAYALNAHAQYKASFPEPIKETQKLVDLFSQYRYNDILVSRTNEIPDNPPQLLSYTMKRVYKVTTPEELKKLTAGIHEPYTVQLAPF